MPSFGQLFVYCLLFDGFFSFQKNFASAGVPLLDESSLFSLSDVSHDLLGPKFRTLIGATKFIPNYLKPLGIFTALDETCLVNQTTGLLDVKVITPKSVATVTGGVLGNEIYEIDHYDFYWEDSLCDKHPKLASYVYFYNWKYASFEEALKHPDSIVVVIFPVSVHGKIPNLKFETFSKILGHKIKEPGDHIKVHSSFTYIWYVHFPYDGVYHSYKKTLIDPKSGKMFRAMILELPPNPHQNFISKHQFMNTFGKIKRDSKDKMMTALVHEDFHLVKESHKGICVVNLPA